MSHSSRSQKLRRLHRLPGADRCGDNTGWWLFLVDDLLVFMLGRRHRAGRNYY